MPVRPANLANPVVTFLVRFADRSGAIEVELDPGKAPLTVANFLLYTGSGFYDGVVFHRLARFGADSAAVAQAGLIAINSQGRYFAKSPLAAPIPLESRNDLRNVVGTIAMARTSQPDSASAQFYFNTANNSPGFDYTNPFSPGYAVFGKTIKGLDVLAAISKLPTRTVAGFEDFPAFGSETTILAARSTQWFSGKRSDYTISASTTDLLVTPVKGGAPQSVRNIDRLQFKDTSFAIDETLTGSFATKGTLRVASADGQRLFAGATADELYAAGHGDVTLDGGAGNDILNAGGGNDSFAFSAPLKANIDTVIGFDPAADRLLLLSSVFSAYVGRDSVPAGDLVVGVRPRATTADHHFLYDTRTGDLAYDPDGSGRQKATVFVKLVGVPAITADDLLPVDAAAFA